MKQYMIYLRGESIEALETLKDHAINVQAFVRMALIEKAKELLKSL